MTSTVSFNGFDLTGTSPLGGRFVVVGVQGWHQVTNRRQRAEKAQQAGAWESTGFASSLPITVTGIATYASDVSAAQERRTLLALGGRGSVELTVTDPLNTGTRIVETDSFTVSPVRDRMFSYTLVVTACDPLLYGPPVFQQVAPASVAGGTGRVWPRVWPRDWGVPAGVTPGSITLANAGTASYLPRVRIDGPITNPVVTLNETGDTIRFNGSIDAGQWLDIDCARRRVLLNGGASRRYAVATSGSWLAVPVGGGSASLGADSVGSSTLMSIWSYESAWE